MPKLLTLKPGSVVYFSGDKTTSAFILKTGGVTLDFAAKEVSQAAEVVTLKPGDIFGVRAMFGKYGQEETATVSQESEIISLTEMEFADMVMSDTTILLKVLKSFSGRLSRVHDQVTALLDSRGGINVEDGLYGVGRYFLESNAFSQAGQAFTTYLTLYPTGSHVEEAKSSLAKSEALRGGKSDAGAKLFVPETNAKTPDTALQSSLAEIEVMMRQKKYAQASLRLSRFVREVECVFNPVVSARADFLLGESLFKMKKWSDAADQFSSFIKKHGSSPDMAEALYYLGFSNKSIGRRDVAISVFQKLLKMLPDDSPLHDKVTEALGSFK